MGISQTPQALVPAEFTSGSMTLLSTTTLSGSTVTVTGISQAYTNLYVLLLNPTWNTGVQLPYFTVDNATSFHGGRINAAGSASGVSGSSFVQCWSSQSSNTAGDGSAFLMLNNYASTTSLKTWFSIGGEGTTGPYTYMQGGIWTSTSAISQIQIRSNQLYSYNGGTLQIYGVK